MKPYYQDDLVTLYHGDALEITNWLNADVLVTDPPYGVNYQSGTMSNANVAIKTKIANDNDVLVRDTVLNLWGNKPAIVFGSWKIHRPPNTKHRLIWHKASNIPGMRATPWFSADEEIYVLGKGFIGKPVQNVIVTHDRRDGAYGEVAKYGHPTPKPVSLLEQLVEKCPNGIIADPFAGVGSTLLAARNLGKKAIGVEMEEQYCKVIVNRLSQSVFDFNVL
jgi:site-specific DNA-methyltransferase (adenine-specific)